MMNALMNVLDANLIAHATKDAYSFRYYGPRNWKACAQLLIDRGYNAAEIDAILRSTITRWATDDITTRRKATAADLAHTLDNRMGGPVKLAEYITGTVEGIREERIEEPARARRATLTLVWSRPE